MGDENEHKNWENELHFGQNHEKTLILPKVRVFAREALVHSFDRKK